MWKAIFSIAALLFTLNGLIMLHDEKNSTAAHNLAEAGSFALTTGLFVNYICRRATGPGPAASFMCVPLALAGLSVPVGVMSRLGLLGPEEVAWVKGAPLSAWAGLVSLKRAVS